MRLSAWHWSKTRILNWAHQFDNRQQRNLAANNIPQAHAAQTPLSHILVLGMIMGHNRISIIIGISGCGKDFLLEQSRTSGSLPDSLPVISFGEALA
jgi:hypothetical protein